MNKFFILILILACLFIFQALPIYAAESGSSFMKGLRTTAESGTGYPDGQRTSPMNFFAQMIGAALTPIFFGVVGMLSLIYAGYKWMMSRGNTEDVELAKRIIYNTIIAMAVALSAYAIVRFIITIWVTPIVG